MKRWITFAGIVLLGVASVVVSERRKVDVPASPVALLYLVADTEQELTRMPVRFTRMSDAEEIRIGNELAKHELAEHEYWAPREEREAPEAVIVEHYLTRVGEQVARGAHRKLPYKFHYIPDPDVINAFALPGGHVYVGAGLMNLMDSEDELAAVIGHEIEHIDHYHCAERVQREQALRKIPLGGWQPYPSKFSRRDTARIRSLKQTARARVWRSKWDTRRVEPSACSKPSGDCTRRTS